MIEVRWLQQTKEDVPPEDDWLCPAELQRLVQFRVPKRRSDWRLGRWTAKRAVACYLRLPQDIRSLGSIEVLPAETGAPRIFLQNKPVSLVVSLSHCAGVAICAVAEPDVLLGCDLERIEPRSSIFVQDYFTLEEQSIVAEYDDAEERAFATTLIWSAKEAALKATQTGLRAATQSVAVSFDKDALTGKSSRALRVRNNQGQCFQGWWRRADALVQCFVSYPASAFPKELILASS